MSTAGAGLPLKIIALLLLVLVGLRGWALLELAAAERELDRATDAKQTDPATRMSWLDAVSERAISANQDIRLATLRSTVSRELILGAATLVWPDGSRLALANALRAPVGAPRAGKPRLVVETATLGRRLIKLEIDGTATPGDDGAWELPLELDSETPIRGFKIAVEIEDAPRHDFSLTFLRDLNPPHLELLTGPRGTIVPEDGIVGLEADETLLVKLRNGTLMRRIRVTLDGDVVLDRANLRTLTEEVFRLGADSGGEPAALLVEAADWSGNVLEAAFELRPLEPPTPQLESATLGSLDLLASTQRTKTGSGAIEVVIGGRSRDGLIHARLGDHDQQLAATGATTRLSLPYEFAPGVSEMPVAIWIERYGRRVDLGGFTLVHDEKRPQIDLLDDSGAPMLVDQLSVSGKQSFRLEIRDDDRLDLGREVTTRKGGLRLEAARKEKGSYSQIVHVDGEGKLLVVATDLAGNESRREFDFTVAAEFGPDDGKGPVVALIAGEAELDPTADSFFWQESGELRLRIEDTGGLDLTTLELERVELLGDPTPRDLDRLEIGVTIEADPTVEIADRHGRRTRQSWSAVIVGGPATFEIDDGAETIEALPVTLKWSLKEVVPMSALRCRLLGADDRETTIEVENGQIRLDAKSAPMNGPHELVLELLTPRGPVTIARAELEIAVERAAEGGGD